MKKFSKNILILLCIIGGYASSYAQNMIGTTYAMANLSSLNEHPGYVPQDGDMMQVRNFRYNGDGGGGLFVYQANAIVNPVELILKDSSNPCLTLQGYPYNSSNTIFDGLFDGMVVVPAAQAQTYQGDENTIPSSGRWIRQWNRGSLNLKWFGANGNSYHDNSPAINAALAYAQFDVTVSNPSESTEIFSHKAYTAPAKTILIPSGTYYIKSPIKDITYGVVFEGEGNMAGSNEQQGTELITQINCVDTTPEHIFSANQHGIFRYIGEGAEGENQANNSGGGFKNLTITVERTNDLVFNEQNVITIYAPQVLPNAATIDSETGMVVRTSTGSILVPSSAHPNNQFNPGVSKWFAENLTINMQQNALRAIYMRSRQQGGKLPWRIRDPNIINCWFSGNRTPGETVTAVNTSGLHVIGGGFTIPNNELASGVIESIPGIALLVGKDFYPYDSDGDGDIDSDDDFSDELLDDANGCANAHLDGVDIANGIIKLSEKSSFINIDCPFGRLEIAVVAMSNGNWPTAFGRGHHGLQVTKQHILNKRDFTNALDPILSQIICPSTLGQTGDHGGTLSNVIYTSSTSSYIPDNNYIKCFNCTQEIEIDSNAPTFND